MLFRMERQLFTFASLLQKTGEKNSPVIIWHENDLFRIRPYPVRMEVPGIFICLHGTMELEINLRPCRLDRHHVLCFTAPCSGRIVSRSDDFRCTGVMFSQECWQRLLFQERSFGSIAVRNAFVRVTDCERERLSRFHDLLCLCADAHTETEKDDDTSFHLAAGMLYQVRNIYRARQAAVPPPTRSEKLLHDFLDLACRDYKCHRRVSYYAERLSVTPRHLTTVVRLASGKSASRWIEEYTALEARILLRNTDLTVKEIAFELQFNDQSLFSKYFKRVTGVSPERYRNT